jgi:hypothetical protein
VITVKKTIFNRPKPIGGSMLAMRNYRTIAEVEEARF